MIGFTQDELLIMMNEMGISKNEQERLLPIMKENYDGYKFSVHATENMYNSNMCLYFLKDYVRFKEIPAQLIDVNIASDYSKLAGMLDLCKGEERKKIIEKTVSGEGIVNEITAKFNPEIGFTEKDLVSMLFYLGYLTITGEEFEIPELKIPNRVMRDIYSDYFLKVLSKDTSKGYNSVMIEFKYLKKGEEGKLKEKQEEARKQIDNYSEFEEIKAIEKLNKYIVVTVNDKIDVEKI